MHTHDPPIVHADIRGASILVKDDFTCCLAEFGLTTAMGIQTITNPWFGKGSLYWMSPEVWNENVDADVPARDIYSFGCTVIEVSRYRALLEWGFADEKVAIQRAASVPWPYDPCQNLP